MIKQKTSDAPGASLAVNPAPAMSSSTPAPSPRQRTFGSALRVLDTHWGGRVDSRRHASRGRYYDHDALYFSFRASHTLALANSAVTIPGCYWSV